MKKSNGKIVFIIILAVSVVMLLASKIIGKSTEDSFSVSEIEKSDFSSFGKLFGFSSDEDTVKNASKITKPYISTISITGVISEKNRNYNQKWLMKQIKKAKDDSKNCGILLVINSPGGTVYESDEAYLELLKYKKATGRPVYAYFTALAASGGYYIGCAADKIFANRNSLTGSIGVIAGEMIDATALMDKIGIKMTTITAGRNKNMGNVNSVLTEEQRAIMQSLADEAYDQFTGIVAESRKMDINAVKNLADGRIYTALQAKKHNLIDDVCTIDEVKAQMEKDLDKKLEFAEFKYLYEESLLDFFYEASSFIKNPEASAYALMSSTAGKCLYLYQ